VANKLRRQIGFWPTVGRLRIADIAGSAEGIGALLLGVGGGSAIVAITALSERTTIAGDYLVITGALFGVVFAAFALTVSLFSNSYLAWLRTVEGGVGQVLEPFLVAVGVQVGVVLATVGYRATATHLPANVEKTVFVAVSAVFVYALLDVVAIGRNLIAHGIARSKAAELDEGGEIRQLPKRRDQAE
jgi:small-conductance mechanosensitive channel